MRKERSCQQQEYRQPRTTRHQRHYQYRNHPRIAIFYRTCSHNCWHIAPKSHKQRYKRTPMQPDVVHQSVHYKCGSSHIARRLHQ